MNLALPHTDHVSALVRLGFDACAPLWRHLRHEFFEITMPAHSCLSFVTTHVIGYFLFDDRGAREKVLVGESAPRTRFKISFKLRCGHLTANSNSGIDCPWCKFRRMRNLSGIVLGKSPLNIFGHADIVMCACRRIREHVYIVEACHCQIFLVFTHPLVQPAYASSKLR